jgi:hypothetical protein
MKESSPFRQFCQEMWFEHKDEILAWTRKPVDYSSDEYFSKQRWMLKRLYKSHLVEMYARENSQQIQKQIKRSIKKGNI